MTGIIEDLIMFFVMDTAIGQKIQQSIIYIPAGEENYLLKTVKFSGRGFSHNYNSSSKLFVDGL